MLRRNADGSITVGMIHEEKPKEAETPVEEIEAEKPKTKRQPRKSK